MTESVASSVDVNLPGQEDTETPLIAQNADLSYRAQAAT